MPDSYDAIIIGGGVIGASIAWRLARGQHRVLLLDAAHVGAEASSAAAGMLTPGGEFDDPTLRDMANRSLAIYPDFVRDLEADSGLSVDFRRTGTVELDVPPRHGSRLLTPGELRNLLPLAPLDAASAIFFPHDAIVDPAALMKALRAACVARGVQLQGGSPVSDIDADSNGAQVGEFRACAAVLSAGAWSSQIRVTLDGQSHPLPRSFPVKGHLLGYRLPPGSLAATLRREHTYVLQRSDGFTIAGSSAEDAGYDRTIDPTIVSDIARRASALVPALDALQPESVWTGLRPRSDPEGPHLGRIANSRLWLAYGHYRNGILLAPATSDRIARQIAAIAALK
ncbi:MAG TPA: FAD-dependent oxidoreductase [Bryobacteraceae bacterium]|nr:FAD-dependent oxidoreductase [Bryobacteraceae bacterium]